MNRFLIGTAIALAMTVGAHAEDEFDCWWSTIDCGGGISSGGQFELNGSIAQWDAGPTIKNSMTGSTFELINGFWAEAASSCLGDLDGSGGIAAPDIAILLGSWGGGGAADLDQSGEVGAPDLAIMLGAWGDCP